MNCVTFFSKDLYQFVAAPPFLLSTHTHTPLPLLNIVTDGRGDREIALLIMQMTMMISLKVAYSASERDDSQLMTH